MGGVRRPADRDRLTLRRKGEAVEVTVTWLEMAARPSFARPPMPPGAPMVLIRAGDPPLSYFRYLYGTVGAQYEWFMRLEETDNETRSFISDPKVSLFTLLRDGWPAGFFVLDGRVDSVADLSYFGLMPEVVGHGLGSWFLKTAIHAGWDLPDTQRMTVNTCTLDHPRALPQYQKHGFQPVRQSTYERVLVRDWDPSTFP